MATMMFGQHDFSHIADMETALADASLGVPGEDDDHWPDRIHTRERKLERGPDAWFESL